MDLHSKAGVFKVSVRPMHSHCEEKSELQSVWKYSWKSSPGLCSHHGGMLCELPKDEKRLKMNLF